MIPKQRVTQIVPGVLLAYLCVLVILTRIMHPKPAPPFNSTVQIIIGVIAIAQLFLAPKIFTWMAKQGTSRATANPEQIWFVTGIGTFSCYLAAALFGFVLFMVHADLRLAYLLFGLSILFMVIWKPAPYPTDSTPDQ